MKLFHALPVSTISGMMYMAKQRIIYAAPSLTKGIASALISMGDELEGRCEVILDYNEELFRLGYGLSEAVTMLLESGMLIRKQAGLRIGCLIIDDQGWSFSLAPMAVEPQHSTDAINAIELSPEQIDQVVRSLNPPLTNDDYEQNLKPQPEIDREAISQTEVHEISKKIQNNPPQAFDLQRHVRVYQAHLQFVEMELEGGRIEQHTLSLPKELKESLFANNKEIEKRLNASYKLIDSEVSAAFSKLRQEAELLRKDYAPSLGSRLGRVLLVSRKQEFDGRVIDLQKRIQGYCDKELVTIEATIEKSLSNLAKTLAPLVQQCPPTQLRARCSEVTSEIAHEYLLGILYKVAPTAKALLDKTKLHCTYKDVTLEMLQNADFQKKILEFFPHEKWIKPFEEFCAAKSKT